MLRHLVFFAFVALWVNCAVAEAPATIEPAKPVNVEPLKAEARESSDDLETDATSWGGYNNGWGGNRWGGNNGYGGSWNVRPWYGGGWNSGSGWGGRGYGGGWNRGWGSGGRGHGGWGGYHGGYWR